MMWCIQRNHANHVYFPCLELQNFRKLQVSLKKSCCPKWADSTSHMEIFFWGVVEINTWGCQVFVAVMKCSPTGCFYPSTFWCLRYYVFRWSVRPSIRSPKFPLSTCTWVHWSIQPSLFFCLSVRPSGATPGHFLKHAWREWTEILHADVSWPPSELIRLWSWSVHFPPFGIALT